MPTTEVTQQANGHADMSDLVSLTLGLLTMTIFFAGIMGLLVGSIQVITGGDWSLMIGSAGLVAAGGLLARQLAGAWRRQGK